MKKPRFVGLLSLALSYAALSGLAQSGDDRRGRYDNDNDDKKVRHVNATEMSALGLLAASALGTSFCQVRRRAKSRD
jgi:hypothetical protein